MMNQERKMSERILNHILEILGLLTGKVSVLEHLTNSLTVMEMNQDKEMSERILSHTLEIIYLLTGEEYTIVKKMNSRHIHQQAGECDADGHKETLGSSSNRSLGHVKPSVVSKFDQESALDLRIYQQVKEEDTPVNISEGHVRPSVVSKFDEESALDLRSHQQVKEEDIPVNVSEGLHSVNMDTISVIKEEEDERDVYQGEIYSDPCAGLHDENCGTVSVNEEEEEERDEKNICADSKQ
ncbi:uncharacterized protein O3C94_014308 [Discoglossus pictus]